eukprot:1159258-Pelagomonas_calceolata.AAC.3
MCQLCTLYTSLTLKKQTRLLHRFIDAASWGREHGRRQIIEACQAAQAGSYILFPYMCPGSSNFSQGPHKKQLSNEETKLKTYQAAQARICDCGHALESQVNVGHNDVAKTPLLNDQHLSAHTVLLVLYMEIERAGNAQAAHQKTNLQSSSLFVSIEAPKGIKFHIQTAFLARISCSLAFAASRDASGQNVGLQHPDALCTRKI